MNGFTTGRGPDISGFGLSAEIDRIAELIAKARRLIGEGRRLDLGSIETRIAVLVDTLKWIPAEQGRRFKASLVRLLADMDRLETDVRSQFLPTANRIGGLEAYRTRRR